MPCTGSGASWRGESIAASARVDNSSAASGSGDSAISVRHFPVIAAIQGGNVPLAALNTHRLQLDRLPAQFPQLLAPGERVIKALVEC